MEGNFSNTFVPCLPLDGVTEEIEKWFWIHRQPPSAIFEEILTNTFRTASILSPAITWAYQDGLLWIWTFKVKALKNSRHFIYFRWLRYKIGGDSCCCRHSIRSRSLLRHNIWPWRQRRGRGIPWRSTGECDPNSEKVSRRIGRTSRRRFNSKKNWQKRRLL